MSGTRYISVGFATFLAFLAVVAPAGTATTISSGERSVLSEMNRVRAAHGLPALRLDPTLVRAARAHTRYMVAKNVFTHGDFGTRMRRFGARGPHLGENLAWGSGSNARAAALVQMWLNSPPHRANLLRRGFRRVGVGALVGTFAGAGDARVVTADFAGT
ncbi:MAG: CAP domain-containing protein [Pseudomonadota bacterium]